MVDRIRQLLQDKQLTPTQFADAIGIARPIVSHILSGRNKTSLEVVQKILAAFADLSMAWLLNGSGPMWATTAPVAGASTDSATAPTASTAAPATPAPLAEAGQTSAATGLAAETSSIKTRRQLNEHPAGESIATNSTLGAAIPATLPMPRRFQAAAPGRTSATEVETAPETPQKRPEATATPEPAAATPEPAIASQPVSGPAPALTAAGSMSAPSGASDVAAAFLLQPGKAIRRIVIFYQDGSFADYQPE